MTAEHQRLAEANANQTRWRKLGPYLSERQWGTVREDYSPGGDAWGYVTHDMARSRAYRWGEDGLAGVSDDQQLLCLALGLWNGQDPILKERLFGLTGPEGNHGEDVKELYYYLDATPTHAYMKLLYKYPQRSFPTSGWCEKTRTAAATSPSLSCSTPAIFDDNRYFDVCVEYAKAGPDDLLMQITVHNRGPEPRRCTCCRSSGFATPGPGGCEDSRRPVLDAAQTARAIAAQHEKLGASATTALRPGATRPCCSATTTPTTERLYGSCAPAEATGFFKDGINDYVVQGRRRAVNPAADGTKAAAYKL